MENLVQRLASALAEPRREGKQPRRHEPDHRVDMASVTNRLQAKGITGFAPEIVVQKLADTPILTDWNAGLEPVRS